MLQVDGESDKFLVQADMGHRQDLVRTDRQQIPEYRRRYYEEGHSDALAGASVGDASS